MKWKQKLMKNPHKVLPQLIATLVSSWGFFCLGNARAWGSPGIPSLNKTLQEPENTPNATDYFEMTYEDLTWISSLPPLCAMVGALLIGPLLENFGRKRSLIFVSVPYIVSFLLMGFTFFSRNSSQLYIGRILNGLAAGAATPASQIYITECSAPSIRGIMGSLTATALALGIVVTYVIGAFVDWYVLAWILSSFPLILLVGMSFLPETPVWLLTHGRQDEARRSLQQLRGRKTNVEPEFKRMVDNFEEQKSKQQDDKIHIADLLKGPVIKPFGISMAIMFFQQFTGINAIVYNTVMIFQLAGSTIDSHYATIIVGFVQLVFTASSGFFVDRFGRRALLLGSAVVVCLSLATMGTFFHIQASWGPEECSSRLGWLPLLALIVFFAAYSCGFANVPFIIMGEMFPVRYRSVFSPVTSSFNLLCAFTVVRCLPLMFVALGRDGTFWFFMICTLMSVVFVALFLPETKGKTLEDIEKLFADPSIKKTVTRSSSCLPTYHCSQTATDATSALDNGEFDGNNNINSFKGQEGISAAVEYLESETEEDCNDSPIYTPL